MALVFMDGFDYTYYGGYSTPNLVERGWVRVGGYLQASENGGRRGGGCIQAVTFGWSGGGGSSCYRDIFNDKETVIVGYAYKGSLPAVRHPLFSFSSDTVYNVSVQMSGDTIYAMRGDQASTDVIGSASVTILADVWYYYEAKVTISDTVGAVEVRINGNTVLNLTNVDTLVSGSAFTRRVRLGGSGSSDNSTGYIDDFYACDTDGSVNNDFLGDVRVDTLRVTGDGDFADFTPLSGSNYQNVDETAPDGDTTYVSSPTVGDKDLYVMSDLTHNPTSIFGVNVCAMVRKSDSSVANSRVVLKSGATTLNGSTDALLETYKTYMILRETDPNTSSAWTQSNVNLIQAGVEVM